MLTLLEDGTTLLTEVSFFETCKQFAEKEEITPGNNYQRYRHKDWLKGCSSADTNVVRN